MHLQPRLNAAKWLLSPYPILFVVGAISATLATAPRRASAEGRERSIGEILHDGGYREDFAGAAYMNKFALAFRVVNNVVCGRCNVTEKETDCLPQPKDASDKCDKEEAYYDTAIDSELDTFLPCLLRDSDESTMLCLMETPMGVPPLEKVDIEEEGRDYEEHTSKTYAAQASGTNGKRSESVRAKKPVIPLRTQEIVDIVSHAKITRVIIGEQSAASVPGRRRTLVHDKHLRRYPDTQEFTNTSEKETGKSDQAKKTTNGYKE